MYVYLFNLISSSKEFRDNNSESFSNFISDVAESLDEITWNLAGKTLINSMKDASRRWNGWRKM